MAYKPKNSVKSLCSGSPITNLKSGGRMISSDKGSSNYMKEDPGSPAKALKPEIKNFFSSLGSKIIYQLGTSPNEKARDKARALGLKNNNTTSVNKDIVGSKNSGQSSTNKPAPDVFKGDFSDPNKTSAGPAPTVKPRKKVESVGRPGKVSGTTVRKTGGGMTGTKVKVSPEIKTSGKTTEGIKGVKAKKANEPKEMSRKQIREAKKKDKDSGMSRKEVRLNKTKRKAASTRAKTVSKETTAKGGKEAQRLRRKTIRLEKKAAKIEGRVKASKIK
jgi:hypothetical protein